MASSLVFNLLDIYTEDSSDDGVTASYVMKMFGRTMEGKSVSVTVTGYQPGFFVKLKGKIKPTDVSEFQEAFKYAVGSGVASVSLVQRKDFMGFSNGSKQDFLYIACTSLAAMRQLSGKITRGIKDRSQRWLVPYGAARLYESNIEPHIRFLHRTGISPCGWVSIVNAHKIRDVGLRTSCDIDVECTWKDVTPAVAQSDALAPFKVSAFDIECYSRSGDFPVASFDYDSLVLTFLDYVGFHGVSDGDEGETSPEVSYERRFVEFVQSRIANEMLVPKTPRDVPTNEHLRKCAEKVGDVLRGGSRYTLKGDRLVHQSHASPDSLCSLETSLSIIMRSALPGLHGDPIIQIGITTHVHGCAGIHDRLLLCLGSCADIDGAKVLTFDDEGAMLKEFARRMTDLDPDVVLGFNTFGFDMVYIRDRAVELRCDAAVAKLGRFTDMSSPFVTKTLSSSALGDNMLRYYDMHGRVNIDLMKLVQRDHKLDSYKLDLVAEHFLGDKKHDVSPKDIFRLHRGTAADRAVIGRYCLQDCELLNRLCDRIQVLTSNAGMASVCSVPLSYIFLRGQGVKTFSLVAKEARADGFVIPVIRNAVKQQDDTSYEGAIVLDPKPGIYNDPIMVHDYASLYPSCIIANNISHDTIVLDDARYGNIPGVKYDAIEYTTFTSTGEKEVAVCRFAQSPKGVLPRILEYLLTQRKLTRNKMKTTTDPNELAVLDGLQLAFKITANSIYGQLGASTSPVCLKQLAASTTASGRTMIMQAKSFMEEQGHEVIYGDSVAGYTPVIVRVHGTVLIDTVENIARQTGALWRPCTGDGRDGKEYLDIVPGDIAVWSDAGWTHTSTIIRHRLGPAKRMVRVVTGQGVVDVTEDHSLLYADGSVLKPTDVSLGDALMHAALPVMETAGTIPALNLDETRIMGFFCAGNVVMPMGVLFTGEDVRRSFWAGVLESVCGGAPIMTHSHIAAARIFALAASLNVPLCVHCDQSGAISLTPTDTSGALTRVTALYELPRGEGDLFVYDFTTSNAHFSAGVGSMVVHNTDSLFIRMAASPERSRHDRLSMAFERGEYLATEIAPQLPKPHRLEFEKVFHPLVLLSKKRYVGRMYEDGPDTKFKLKSMGIVLKRRDNAPIVKTVFGGIVDRLMEGGTMGDVVSFYKDALDRLVSGGFALDELVITKSLKGAYKDPTRIAHKVLADRITKREPGNAPAVNDRIPYVYVCTQGGSKQLQGERIETPTFIVESGLLPDYKHYITNQISKPVGQLLALVVEQLPGYDRPTDYWQRVQQALQQKLSGEKLMDKIDALREDEVQRLLVEPILVRLGDKAKRRRAIV